jgi:hypothetical protein
MSGRYRITATVAAVLLAGAVFVPASPALAVTCDNGLTATCFRGAALAVVGVFAA